MTHSQMRAVGALGMAAVACFIVAFVADPTPPVAGADPSSVVGHIHQFATGDRIAGFFFAASGALLVAFAAGLGHALRRASSAPGWLGSAVLAGGVQGGTLITATSVVFFTLGARAATLDATSAGVLSDLANYGFAFAGFGVLVFVASASALMLRAHGALRILGELGAAVSVLLVVYVICAFVTSGPFTAGAVVSIVCFTAAAVWVAFTAMALLVLEGHALFGAPLEMERRGGRTAA